MSVSRAANPSNRQWLLLILTLGLLCWTASAEITDSAVTKDASENLQMALNLAHHGVMSLDTTPPFHPSMMREPVPIAVLAGAIYLSDRYLSEAPSSAYFSGTRARVLKHVNLLWLSLLTAAAFLAVQRFTCSFALAWVASTLIALHFTWFVPMELRKTLGVNNLDTELAGAMLVMTACLLLAIGQAKRRALFLVAAAVSFGLAALTKAAVFYVGIGVLLAVSVYYACRLLPHRQAPPPVGLLLGTALAFLLVTLSWMARNYVQTGYFQIAERSGSVLMHRAFMDTMTPAEYLGALTVWSEPHVMPLLSRLTGFTLADEQAGGRLQRLAESFSGPAQVAELSAEDTGKPQEARSWYRKARALYEQKLAQFTRAGVRYPSGAADRATRQEAVALILQHPIKHGAVTALLIWRGAPLLFAILLAAAIRSWRCGRADVVMFTLPGIGLVLFYAAASQFAPRFAEIIFPLAIVALWVLIAIVSSPSVAPTGGAPLIPGRQANGHAAQGPRGSRQARVPGLKI